MLAGIQAQIKEELKENRKGKKGDKVVSTVLHNVAQQYTRGEVLQLLEKEGVSAKKKVRSVRVQWIVVSHRTARRRRK